MSSQEIQIRRAEPDDYRALHAIHAQPRAIWGTLQMPFPSAELWRKRLAEQPEHLYALVASVSGEIVGTLGLSIDHASPRRRHAGQVGLAVHDRWHRRRIGLALLDAAIDLADNWLNLLRLELTVYTDNAPAVRLYERAGFEIEGTLRRYAFRNGELIDAYSMARLK
jgi:putative acetyltransferase